ncbi:MAG: metallopeptidase TldD-related protein [Bryobacteraceae bacterium]
MIQVRASAYAADGATVRDAAIIPRASLSDLPTDPELTKAVTQVANNLKALTAAPVGETYSGPVLFEEAASAQLIAEVLGPHLALTRKPVGEPGRQAPFMPSELEGRIGSRILPEFLDVVDDPIQKVWAGTPLFGSFDVDEEGITPKPVTLIEKGRLKSYLLTRQPVKGFDASNGRARLPGQFGARAASISNLFVKASESLPRVELRKKLIEMVQARSKPYGIIA